MQKEESIYADVLKSAISWRVRDMPNEVNIYTPRYLAEVVRLAPPVFTFFRDTFFTNVRTFPTKAIDFDLVKGDRRMAAFVHPRKGGKVLASAGYETLSYKPPLINPYDVTTADQLMNRLPGEEMYSGMTPAQRAAQQQIADYTPWIILPVVLGMLCTMLMYNENQYDMLKQLWIVPVNKMAYFFSKFAVVLVYSICFMLVTATASILTGILSGYIPFDSESVLYLLRKCMEISLLTAFAVLPLLAVAAAQKGYILPVCLTLIYTFLGFILLMVNMYLHPLSSMTAIVMYDIPGVVFDQPLNIPAAFLCIGVWAAASAVLANVALVRRK